MADAHKQYQASFLIGARLQGSFNATMVRAQGRLMALHRTATGLAARLGGVFRTALGGLATFFGGFAIGNLWHRVTEEATKAAIEMEQRHRRLAGVLMGNASIQKKGVDFAKQQAELIFQHNEELAKQQIFGHATLDTMSTMLGVMGIPPKEIVKTTDAMADMLAAAKGVTATAEDGQQLSKAWGVAIRTGMTRALRAYDIVLTDSQQKEFKALKNVQKRHAFLMKIAQSPVYKGRAAQLMKTDEGRVKMLDRALHEMSVNIGREVLPIQAQMADAWRAAVPAITPAISAIFRGLLRLFTVLGKQAADFFRVLETPPALEAWQNLKLAFGDVLLALGELVSAFGFAQPKVVSFGTALGTGVVNESNKLANDLRSLADLIAMFANQVRALQKDMGDMMDSTRQEWAFITGLWEGAVKGYNDLVNAVNVGAQKMIDIFQSLGSAIKNLLLAPITSLQTQWEQAMDQFRNRPRWMGGTGGPLPTPPPVAQPPLPAAGAPPGFQFGGILRTPTLARVAEHGPEAIIPLSGGARAEGLLDYASRIIMGRPNIGATTVSFAPVVNINGNATETEQRAMDSRLRDLARDFIEQFKAAQYQERRLSYESGYG